MKAVVKINETQVPRLRMGQRALVRIVGTPDPVAATITKISPMADGGSRWWNPDLREYPVEMVLDQSPPDVRPGLSAQVEIFVEQIHNTLAVPLAGIYSQGKESYVFVRRGEEVEPVKVDIGGASETHAAVARGLKRGEDVLILAAGQGRQLLERAGIDTGALASGEGGERGPGPAPKTLKLDNGRGRSSRAGQPADAKASAEKVAGEKAAVEKGEKETQPTVVAAAPKEEPKAAPAQPAAPSADKAGEPRVAPAVGRTAAPAKPIPTPVTAVDVTQ
jgi:HlyD family secretion protein